jgi:uncharacterized protein YdeI (YjbR/CyaY-like superfamily)
LWSRVNLERFEALKAEGKMTEAGERALAEGSERKDHYSYENAPRSLAPDEEAQFRSDAAGWADFGRRPPGYRKLALFWVTSAKRPETRARRLATLIEESGAGRKIGVFDIGRRTNGSS